MLICDNKYIPNEDKDFFILLRIGLWQKVEEELSPSPDWDYIYRLSTEQTVQGIVSDGIEIYKTVYKCNIPEEINDKFLQQAGNIISRNIKVNALQAKLCKLFDDPSRLHDLFPRSKDPEILKSRTTNTMPIPYVVLKGQAVAQCYPKPLMRVCGDLDFFFTPQEYERAKAIIKQIETSDGIQQEGRLHYHKEIKGIIVELHGPEKLNFGKKIANVLQQEFDKMIDSPNKISYNCNGTQVHLPTPEYNALYIFMHCLQHLFTSGLGLRQICDFAQFMNQIYKQSEIFDDVEIPGTNDTDIDDERLYETLLSMNLIHAWDVFLAFATQVLDLPLYHHALIKKSELSSFWILMKSSGNMGHQKEYYHDQGFIQRNINTLKQRIQISILRHSISPALDNYMTYRILKVYGLGIRRRVFG